MSQSTTPSDNDIDRRPDWMQDHGLTRADLEEEANSNAPDAWVFEAALQSLDSDEGDS